MDTQLVLPGQMQLSQLPEAALPNDPSSRERLERVSLLMQGGDSLAMRLPMPRPSDEESLQERLRSLEAECQKLRQENAELKLQTTQGKRPVPEAGAPSRLKNSISVAETQHQVLRQRMRAMLEEQQRLVDELQQEIAKVRHEHGDTS